MHTANTPCPTDRQRAAVHEAYEDFCLSFFIELRDNYHYSLSADQLLRFLKIEDIDIADENAVCTNMMMFFCHRQYECEKFPEIFHHFYCSEKNESAMRLKKLEKQQGGRAGENKNVFLQKPADSIAADQKVHFSLPNFKAERFFAQFELQEGICDYSAFLHAGFLNLYEDYISYYDTLDDTDRKKLIDTLVSELSRFIRYCKRVLDDAEDFNRKALELAATFKMAGNREQSSHGEEPSDEAPDEDELQKQLEEERLRFQELPDTRIPMSEDLTKKDIRLLTKHDMEQIAHYIRENAHKFKARVSRNLKKPGKADFDYKTTVKEAFRTGLVPVELFYKTPRPRKTKIVCLLDISPSCLSAATVLVHFLHQLGEAFHGGVEIYFFTDHAEKVSAEVRSRTVQDCVAKITADSKNTVSDYSEALESFNKNYYRDLTRDTIFLLLGDMRNNYKRYRKEALSKIQSRVHNGHGKTILLNTDPRRRWYADDSVLKKAEKNLDEIYEVRTVENIIRFLCQLEPA